MKKEINFSISSIIMCILVIILNIISIVFTIISNRKIYLIIINGIFISIGILCIIFLSIYLHKTLTLRKKINRTIRKDNRKS